MKKVDLLSKDDMKNVMGGVMDKETTLQHCLDHLLDNSNGDPIEDQIILSVGTDICWKAYDKMTS